jgi:peptidoglycan/xylan/chitin deacetylase (PgdA/CDA1 family)
LKLFKRAALHAAKATGLFHLTAGSHWRHQRLLILAFHSVAVDEEHQWLRLLYHTPEEFERRLRLIARWRLNVLPLGEALARLTAGTLPARSAVLTFDDGQADFCRVVWPMLERFGYPATVYVTTYYSEKQVPIFPLMCSYVLWKARHRGRLAADPALGLPATDLGDDLSREKTAAAVVAFAYGAGLDAAARNARLVELAGRLDVDYTALMRRRVLQIMTRDELRAVAACGADVQLHTHRHRTPANRLEFIREIQENRAYIEAATGQPAVHFCYPSGVYHPECLPWLAALGVESATTCEPSLAQADDSRLTLPRLVDTTMLNEVEVEGWLSGFSQCLLRRRTRDAPQPMPVAAAAAK